jgi:hypothetical protein
VSVHSIRQYSANQAEGVHLEADPESACGSAVQHAVHDAPEHMTA